MVFLRVTVSLTVLLLFMPRVALVAQDSPASPRGVRGAPRQVTPPAAAPADPSVCKQQIGDVLNTFDREDACTMTTERLREVAIEFRRVQAEVCHSGVSSIEETLAHPIRYERNRKCQFKVTGQSLPDWIEGPGRDETRASAMSPAVQDALFTHTKASSPSAYDGLKAQVGGVAVLTINSARADLARLMKAVFARNAIRYVPVQEQVIDTVQINCGDQSDRASFHCAQLNVVGADGTPVLPVQFKDDPFLYRDKFELQQGVRIFRGTYRAELLADGFTVNYGSARRTTHTVRVTAAEAANVLLLGVSR